MTDDAWKEPTNKEQINSAAASRSEPARVAPNPKEWQLLESMLTASVREQRASRRWGIFFKSLTFLYLFFFLYLFSFPGLESRGVVSDSHTALVEVRGQIGEDQLANADSIVTGLRDAFENRGTKAVILRINSPGGTPVQAGYVYDEIWRLRERHPDIKLYAVIGDLGASGGYYIASAANEIYADKSSLVGSIGVTAATFGFVEALDKLGIERRLYTAGENKAFLDPFSPADPGQEAFWQEVLEVTHQQFIDSVRRGRGDRLVQDPRLFSGLIWSGEQALELGLIDGLGSPGYVAREIIGEENIINFTPRQSPFRQLVDRFGVSVGNALAQRLGFSDHPLRY